MSFAKLSPLKWLVLGIGAFVAAIGIHASAQATPRINAGKFQITGIPEDWSSRHVVFTDPGTEEDAIKTGAYEKWLKTVNDPRYVFQQLKRNGTVRGPLADDAAFVQHLKTEFLQSHRPDPHSPFQPKKHQISPESALKNDWAVNLSTSTVMPATFPAKYTFSPIGAPSCTTDFVAYPTGATGAAGPTGAATIIAFNELYPGASPGCGTSGVPQVYWAYNTTISGTSPGAVTTSPVLSLDGTKLAFIQSDGTHLNVIVLKTVQNASATFAAPVSITSASANMGCTAPCMTVSPLTGNGPTVNSDTFSSPYYDYNDDILYVGDDYGNLYQITPVFNSTTTSPAVTTVNSGYFHEITSPVYDATSGCVFVGDNGGFIFSYNSGIAGTVCTSATFSVNATSIEMGTNDAGVHDGVLVDSTAGEIYAFLGNCAGISGALAGLNCVAQYPTNFINAAAPSGVEALGAGTFGNYVYSGTFDNVYYSSTNSASPSGNIWVVGQVSDYTGANLYQIPIASNVLGTPVATTIGFHNTVDNSTPNFASPVTEFCNNGGSPCVVSSGQTTSGTDSIYFSINQGLASGCNSTVSSVGCVEAYNVSNPASPTLTGSIDYTYPTKNVISGCWGTSSIIIDNDSTSTGASEVYYMYFGGNLPSPGNPDSVCGTSTGGTAQAIQTLQGTL
jgi:hypothetical protein